MSVMFDPPEDCSCTWASQFEGEVLGTVHTIRTRDRRCLIHGSKPRQSMYSSRLAEVVAERDKLAERVRELESELAVAEGHAHRADANRYESDAKRLRAEAEVASLKSAWTASRADDHDEARARVSVLEERIRAARQQLLDCAHDSDGMCSYGQRALAALDGEGEERA